MFTIIANYSIAEGPLFLLRRRITPSRIKIPPIHWIGLMVSPRIAQASRAVKRGSMVLTMEDLDAPRIIIPLKKQRIPVMVLQKARTSMAVRVAALFVFPTVPCPSEEKNPGTALKGPAGAGILFSP